MKKLSFDELKNKYNDQGLSVDEMGKVNGGCADFSDVTVKVSTTACVESDENPFKC